MMLRYKKFGPSRVNYFSLKHLFCFSRHCSANNISPVPQPSSSMPYIQTYIHKILLKMNFVCVDFYQHTYLRLHTVKE